MKTVESPMEIGNARSVEPERKLWKTIQTALAIVGVSSVVAFSIWMEAPSTKLLNRTPEQFSADRAMIDVDAIAQRPHPIGSEEHSKVQRYIVNRLAQMRLKADIQTGSVVQADGKGGVVGANVENIVVRLRGTGAPKAILLVAHYDTVSTSAGAADDTANVAAILEILRAVQAGAPLKHDVVALFTDGEEIGLMGSTEFVKEQSRVKEIGLVINMEARGDRGSSLMFETSPNNGRLIRQLAQSSSRPVTSSLMYEVYKRMPNGTDLTTFKHANLPGLNFAFIEGSSSYHSATDNRTQLNHSSLQDQGSSVLGLVLHFGNLEKLDGPSKNELFFDLPGRFLIHYPQSWNYCFIAISFLWLSTLLFFKLRSGEATLSGIAGSLLLLLASSVLAYGTVWIAILGIQSGNFEKQFEMNYMAREYHLAFVAWTLSICSGLHYWFRKRVRLWSVLFGASIVCVCLTLAAAWWVPGASFLFLWPLLLCLVAATNFSVLDKTPDTPLLRSRAAAALCLIAMIALVAPTINLILIGLGLSLSRLVMPLAALFIAMTLVLMEFSGFRGFRFLTAIAGIIAAFMFLGSAVRTRSNALKPRVDSVFYLADPTINRALWASLDAMPDPWTAGFLTAKPSTGSLTEYRPDLNANYLQSPAPVGSWSVPTVDLVREQTNAEGRTLCLRLRSARGAAVVGIYMDSRVIKSVTIEGQSFPASNRPSSGRKSEVSAIEYYNAPARGIEVTIRAASGVPISGTVIDRSYGLPLMLQHMGERPEDTIPRPSKLSDTTQVRSTFHF